MRLVDRQLRGQIMLFWWSSRRNFTVNLLKSGLF